MLKACRRERCDAVVSRVNSVISPYKHPKETMMLKSNRMVAGALVAVTLMGFSGVSLADGAWAKAHPRRDEVNDRLANQNKRIQQQVKEGDLTHAQAAKLRTDDRQIRGEERAMASQNGGHITKTEQNALNQQENAVSKQIGK
jgi:hypothetical protein